MKPSQSSPTPRTSRSWRSALHRVTGRVRAAARSGALAALVGIAAAASLPASAAPSQPLKIGGKNFTEQLVLASITSQYLHAHGFETDLTSGLGSTLMRKAMETDQLDLVWEYTGTSLIVYNNIQEKLDADATYARVRQLDGAKGLIWLRPSGINNTYALAMPRHRAEAAGLTTLSGLAERMRKAPEGTRHPFAIDMEFAARPDGLEPLKALYRLPLTRRDVIQLDPGLVYTALKNDQVEIGLVYRTDGRVKGFDLVLLEDDLHFFPAYHAAPVVRRAVLDAHPELEGLLNRLSEKLDDAVMTEMNYQVDIAQQPVDKVAEDFLRSHGLL